MSWIKKIFRKDTKEPLDSNFQAASNVGNKQQAYTGEQMNKALKAYKSRKFARQKAREEEACYVAYRKAEILSKFQPTVGTLRSADEAFPKRRKGSMGFGERKAHYLSIRPKPCYATWLGRRRNIIEAKPSPMAIAASVDMTDHSAMPSDFAKELGTKRSDDSSSSSRKNSSTKQAIKGDKAKLEAANASNNLSRQDGGAVKGLGYNAENPLINGMPFWTIQMPQDEDQITDDDLPVDMDILEQVCTGKKALDSRPFEKVDFNPFGSVIKMKADDPLFDRDTILFANTVETVIRLQPEGDEQLKGEPKAIDSKIKWSDKITVTTFDVRNRQPNEIRTPVEEPLRDLKRDRKVVVC